jgi:hypothetical protein
LFFHDFLVRSGVVAPVATASRNALGKRAILLAMLHCGNEVPEGPRTAQQPPLGGTLARTEKLAPPVLLGFNLNKVS